MPTYNVYETINSTSPLTGHFVCTDVCLYSKVDSSKPIVFDKTIYPYVKLTSSDGSSKYYISDVILHDEFDLSSYKEISLVQPYKNTFFNQVQSGENSTYVSAFDDGMIYPCQTNIDESTIESLYGNGSDIPHNDNDNLFLRSHVQRDINGFGLKKDANNKKIRICTPSGDKTWRADEITSGNKPWRIKGNSFGKNFGISGHPIVLVDWSQQTNPHKELYFNNIENILSVGQRTVYKYPSDELETITYNYVHNNANEWEPDVNTEIKCTSFGHSVDYKYIWWVNNNRIPVHFLYLTYTLHLLLKLQREQKPERDQLNNIHTSEVFTYPTWEVDKSFSSSQVWKQDFYIELDQLKNNQILNIPNAAYPYTSPYYWDEPHKSDYYAIKYTDEFGWEKYGHALFTGIEILDDDETYYSFTPTPFFYGSPNLAIYPKIEYKLIASQLNNDNNQSFSANPIDFNSRHYCECPTLVRNNGDLTKSNLYYSDNDAFDYCGSENKIVMEIKTSDSYLPPLSVQRVNIPSQDINNNAFEITGEIMDNMKRGDFSFIPKQWTLQVDFWAKGNTNDWTWPSDQSDGSWSAKNSLEQKTYILWCKDYRDSVDTNQFGLTDITNYDYPSSDFN